MRFGRFEVALLSDGIFKLDGGTMFGIVPRALWSRVMTPDERNRVSMPMNCLVVRDDRHVLLFETGVGDKLPEKQRDIFGIERERGIVGELAGIGVGPDDVTLVLNTHLHFDHGGGNTKRDERGRLIPTFPRAKYVIQKLEWEDALHPNERHRGSYFEDDVAPVEKAAEFVDGDAEIFPGVSVLRVGGHTRGTQCLMVRHEGRTLFFGADFMPTRHHLPLPWISAVDNYPVDSLMAKKRLLPQAVAEQWIFAFSHDGPSFGRIVERDGRHHFVDLVE